MKAKATITYEYEIDPSAYPEDVTPEEIAAIDLEGFTNEPWVIVENGIVGVEVLKEPE